jgi:hypothetical protein
MTRMVNVTFLVLGLALLLTVMIDALATTLAVRAGAGPLTQRLTASLWNLLLRLHRRDWPPSLLGVRTGASYGDCAALDRTAVGRMDASVPQL